MGADSDSDDICVADMPPDRFSPAQDGSGGGLGKFRQPLKRMLSDASSGGDMCCWQRPWASANATSCSQEIAEYRNSFAGA